MSITMDANTAKIAAKANAATKIKQLMLIKPNGGKSLVGGLPDSN